MMILGSMYIFNDPNAALSTIATGSKIIVMSEEIPVNENDPNVIAGTCLLPPPIAKIAEIDGDAERFYELYSEHLLSDIPVDFISVILGFMHNGGNISILVNCALDETWVMYLVNHFMMYYGINIGSQICPFGYDPSFDDCINGILYSANIETPMEFLKNHTVGKPFSDYELIQLQSQLHYYTLNPQKDFNDMALGFKTNPSATLAVSFNPNRIGVML